MLSKTQEHQGALANKVNVSDTMANGNVVLYVSPIITRPAYLPACVVLCVIPGNDWTPFVVHDAGFMAEPDKGVCADGIPWHGRWVTSQGEYVRNMADAVEAFRDRCERRGVLEDHDQLVVPEEVAS